MNKITEFIKKNIVSIAAILFALVWLRTCTVSSTNERLVKQNASLVKSIDSLKTQLATKEDLNTMYQVQMYEFLKLSLYDWNTVVRSTQRPDDIIKKYDDEIKRLSKLQ